ncbi:LONRF3 [Symbiodinium natans]|uniref:LONRF3 protein n=1 Tax=Symbiodinium natans TaxID=878477 RepID=A0A812KBY1_9DINO|nr:LONRF3 [Symbiodinium natans]
MADESIPPHLECAICMKLLLEPVSVPCGHTFCQTCLDQALGYRNLCAVCRAPVPPGQSVNILIRSMISEQYPRALASRRREVEEELRQAERSAEEERLREVAAGAPANAEANGPGGADAIILPVLRHARPMLPQCRIGHDLDSQGELLVNFAVQGGRRICVMQPGGDAGICMSVEQLRPAARQQPAQVTLVGKFRVRLTEPPNMHEDGFELGRFEAYFDTPLPLNLLGREAPEGGDGEEPAPVIAEGAMQAVERQLEMLGSGSRYVFTESCGEPPAALRRRPGGTLTSADLEQISFWLLGAIMMSDADRKRWVESTDTQKRLTACRKKLQEAGARPVLNLPGSDSWMHPTQSSWSSLVLLLVVLAVLLAKALGLFDSWGKSSRTWNSRRLN